MGCDVGGEESFWWVCDVVVRSVIGGKRPVGLCSSLE